MVYGPPRDRIHHRGPTQMAWASALGYTPPKEYFPIVHDIIREHGGLFISDEVQTGWGRPAVTG